MNKFLVKFFVNLIEFLLDKNSIFSVYIRSFDRFINLRVIYFDNNGILMLGNCSFIGLL